MASSTSLLANLQNKRMQIALSGKTASSGPMHDFDSALSMRLRKYFRRMSSKGSGPTTRDLLAEFTDVPDSHAATFRSMLKSVAFIKNGHWIFKEDSQT